MSLEVRNLTNLSWWEWDWYFYWPEWSVRIADNIDLQKVEWWVRIANSKITDTTYNWDLQSVNPYEPFCFETMNWSTAEIYYNKVKVLELSSWLATAYKKMVWWGKMTRLADNTSYSYGFTMTNSWQWQIHRFDPSFTWVSYNIGWNRTLWAWRTANPLYERMSVLSLPWRIVFAWANTIFQISNWEVITKLLELPKEVDILKLVVYQDTYKIYYNWPNKWWQTDSYIAYWDWFASLVSQFVEYKNSPVRMVVNDWAYDYAVFGDNYSTDLYYVWGLNRWNPILVNTEWDFNNNQREFWYDWVVREWVLYFTWRDKLTNYCLFCLGKYYPWMQTKLSSVMKINSMNTILNTNTQWLEVYDNNTIYRQSFFTMVESQAQASLYSWPMRWNTWIDTKKTIQDIYIAYELLNASDSIQIYARKDRPITSYNTAWWTLIKTITWNDYKNKRWIRVSRNELTTLSLGNFYMLEYKIVLNRWYQLSPIFYWIRTIYDDNLN